MDQTTGDTTLARVEHLFPNPFFYKFTTSLRSSKSYMSFSAVPK